MAKNQLKKSEAAEGALPGSGEPAGVPLTGASPTTVLRITSKQPGFRRAGYAFGPEAVELRLADLTDEQIEQLLGEPMLVCVAVEVEAPAAE